MSDLIRVDVNSGVPVFRQIVEQLRVHIASGRLGAGDEIPSTRMLSQDLGVNPMTVSKAFVLLEEEGLVERRPGLPLIVRPRRRDAADQDRTALLEASLEQAVQMARQLGISTTQATALYRRMLSECDDG